MTRDGKRVLFATSGRSAYTVKSIPAEGDGPSQELLMLTGAAYSLDAGPDGSIYLDQWHRASTLLRFSASGGHAEQFAEFPARVLNREDLAVLQDGRTVVSQRIGASTRLLALEPGKDPAPLITPASPPVAGGGTVRAKWSFLRGRRQIGLSVSNGQILRRIPFNHRSARLPQLRRQDHLLCRRRHGMGHWKRRPKELRAGDCG
jgi:hypothetical protein